MRILHVIQTLDPDYGGPPMVAASLAAAQAALSHDVVIASYAQPGREQAIGAMLRKVPGIERVRREDLPRPGRIDAMFAAGARRLLPKLVEHADIIHAHGVWEPVIKAAADAAQRQNKPYVIRPYGTLDPWSLQQKRLKKRLALLLGYRAMLQRAAFLHMLNADEARLIKPLGLRTPVRVIPNGVFPDEFERLPARGTFRAARGELGDHPFILFLSRLHYKKGLDFLADAFAIVARSMPQVRLVVAGPDEGAREDFLNRLTRLGIRDAVILTGPLYGAEKIAAMVDAECFCLPSRQEGFSVAITEALACGTPVVISENCHFPEVAEHGAGEITPLDGRLIGEALLRVLGDPARRKRMGDAGRTLVLTRYTWPAIAQQTIEGYQSALARP